MTRTRIRRRRASPSWSGPCGSIWWITCQSATSSAVAKVTLLKMDSWMRGLIAWINMYIRIYIHTCIYKGDTSIVTFIWLWYVINLTWLSSCDFVLILYNEFHIENGSLIVQLAIWDMENVMNLNDRIIECLVFIFKQKVMTGSCRERLLCFRIQSMEEWWVEPLSTSPYVWRNFHFTIRIAAQISEQIWLS